MVADDHAYSTLASQTLPALTRTVRFDYTALSLSIPERVRFRYKLAGFDPAWSEPGIARQAIYNNLRPGNYTFNVIASNNDGVWNETGAVMAFTILPAWYQTNWFLAACAASGLLILWVAYRFRLHQVANAISARFDERLDERTRIARELHDSLLQTIQGSLLISDVALEKRDDPAGMGQAIERLHKCLGQAVLEGRAALNSLRISPKMTNDLREAFQRATQEGNVPASMNAEVIIVGEARDMHPMVRDEIYCIGSEAIRNACQHSLATNLLVEVQYGRDLVVKISDNGVGLPQNIASEGKAGHFGLTGMRERARKIAADFQVTASPGHGTTISVRVPGHVVFIKTESRFRRVVHSLRRPKHHG